MKIEDKSVISIIYTGKLDNGEVFISVTREKPLLVTMGNHDIPPSLEQALLGMATGESKKVRLPPEEGFGPRRKELLHSLSRTSFGDKISPAPGMILSQSITKDGEEHKIPATILEVREDTVLVDYNHPLAGHHLTYDLTVLEIMKGD
ncbi:MAG: peptidylprolyl isomerase [Desulfocapsaceae bacterium]|nr:peptidylprolyl isomerase [Desulfocapsaceae bacterium]